MAMTARIAALLTAVGLSACGTTAQDPLLGAVRGIAQGVLDRGQTAETAPTVGPRQVLTRDIINLAALPLILLEADEGASLTMVRVAVNGVNETWQGEGDLTVTLSREGVLRATRGAGYDVYASDIEDTRAALTGGRSGHVDRLYVFVEGDLDQQHLNYSCEMAHHGSERISIFGQTRSLTRVTETCSLHPAGAHVFENRYWIDASGFAWMSEQWAGSELGHLHIERLYR